MAGDIDIDFRTDFNPHDLFNWPRASMVKAGALAPHPCGYYPQFMAQDPVSSLAAIPYKEAAEVGYTKIDALHLSVYDHFQSREEITALLAEPPDWGLLLIPSQQRKLFQLAKHGDVLDQIAPQSVQELADVLALIRPGKRNLVKLYRAYPEKIRQQLYSADDSGYSFKKSHSIAYALVIILQLQLIGAGLL